MSIGTTIKKLRRDRGFTQEQLAEWLGVSTNAVSQWECDKTAPDISHLPMLANIFEVSADVLLEINIAKNKKQADLNNFTVKYTELHLHGRTAERLALCRTMQKKYPNDETVRYYLMCALQSGYMDECFDEIVALGEQLLESASMEYRMGAIRGLCFTYLHKGEKTEALRYADMLPSMEDLHVHVLEGSALIEHCQNYFWELCNRTYLYMKSLLDCESARYSPQEKHAMWRTLYDMYGTIFSDGDFGFWHERLAKIKFFMAMESAKDGCFDKVLDELEEMVIHIEKHSEITEISHTSLLVNKVKTNGIPKHSEETPARASLRYLIKQEGLLKPILQDRRYLHIKQHLAAL